LNVRGLMNVQFAVKGEDVYVLEVNPRASRTVPFVSKAIVYAGETGGEDYGGKTLRELGFTKEIVPKHFSRERSRLPVSALSRRRHFVGPGNEVDRRSDGMDVDLGLAYAKSQMAAPPPFAEKGERLHQCEGR